MPFRATSMDPFVAPPDIETDEAGMPLYPRWFQKM